MQKKSFIKSIWNILRNTFKEASNAKITKLSGSLAYYTLFSMGPLLVVIISVCSLLLGREAIEGKIYATLESFIGHDTALQLQQIIKNAALTNESNVAMITGIIILLIGATTMFAEIQDSINMIWGLKPKPKKGWLKFLQNRVLSFSVIISLGFLLLVSLGINTIIDVFSDSLAKRYPEMALVFLYIINVVITFFITALIFGVIFKVLPDAKIKWRHVRAGAFTTAILFMLGKFGISLYVSKSNIGSTYGAAGSLVILLVWVYYSSVILYFGAVFTKAFAMEYGSEIHPNDYAVTTRQIEVENSNISVQEANKEKIKQE